MGKKFRNFEELLRCASERIHSIRGLTVSQWRDTVRSEFVLEDESGIWELASCEGIEGERSGPWHQSGQRHCGDLWHKQGDQKTRT